MPTTFANFQKYLPSSSIEQTVITPLLERADRWLTRQTANYTGLTQADLTDAACAYAYHLYLEGTASETAALAGQKIDLKDRGSVTYGDGNAAQDSAQTWLEKAFQHLYDAGIPRPSAFAGVER